MSWIFGLGGSGGGGRKDPREPGGVDGLNRNDEPQENASTETRYRFDSAALERAAKAAKDLESSVHARDALELAKTQERTKQLELEASIKQFTLNEEQLKLEQAKQFGAERRAMMEEETKQANQRALYQDQLARRRHEDQLRQQKALQDEILHQQESSVAKQEEIKKRTVEYEAQLKYEFDMKKMKAEHKARAEMERENRDVYLEQIKVKASEHRKTVLEGVQTFGTMLGSGFRFLIEDPNRLALTAGGISLMALGIYGARTVTSVVGKYISSRIGRPALVRDTSRLNVQEFVRHPIKVIKRTRAKAEDSLKGVFLEPALEERLRELAVSTRNTRLNRGLFRNILMHGPPGTGKTLFAKKLALHSGMDYAILTGGDIAPLGSEAVSSIHNVFDWANSSRRGLLLFMDEADAFLRKRATQEIHEDVRAALNAFLYRTGEQSDRFMLMLASNEPEQFDWAVNDRIDDIVTFKLPSVEERKRMIFYYFDKYIVSTLRGKRKIRVGDFDFTNVCDKIAEKTEGFSGRELSKLIVACQASAFASDDCVLTEEMINNKLEHACMAHKKKTIWNVEAKLPNQQMME
ncbi:hypothetical protein ACOME3_008616 [Neoechinorhynchus agilis]